MKRRHFRRLGKQRGEQLLRLFCVAELLSERRFPVTAYELRREVAERTGATWHVRSIYRDLLLLECMGYAEQKRRRTVGGPRSWRWTGATTLIVTRDHDPLRPTADDVRRFMATLDYPVDESRRDDLHRVASDYYERIMRPIVEATKLAGFSTNIIYPPELLPPPTRDDSQIVFAGTAAD